MTVRLDVEKGAVAGQLLGKRINTLDQRVAFSASGRTKRSGTGTLDDEVAGIPQCFNQKLLVIGTETWEQWPTDHVCFPAWSDENKMRTASQAGKWGVVKWAIAWANEIEQHIAKDQRLS